MPALLISASIVPKRSRAISIACAQPVSVLRSATIGHRRSVLSHKLSRRSSLLLRGHTDAGIRRINPMLGELRERLLEVALAVSTDKVELQPERRRQEFSSFDVACHVTLRLGVIHAVDG
jgi:hypothetical protein